MTDKSNLPTPQEDLNKRFEGSYFKVFAKISKSFSPFK